MKRVSLISLLTIPLFVLAACAGSRTEATDSSVPTTTYLGDVTHGKTLYIETCVACHGQGGEGIENLGKPFTTSEFIRNKTDRDLLAFINEGRATDDPANTTGVGMLPKGGNPTLSDEDILDIIAYIRSIQQ